VILRDIERYRERYRRTPYTKGREIKKAENSNREKGGKAAGVRRRRNKINKFIGIMPLTKRLVYKVITL